MQDILKLARIQIGVIILFIGMKAIRSTILKTNAPAFIDGLFLSFPNFCEAIVGVLIVTSLALYLNDRWGLFSDKCIYALSVLMAGVYVILQEFRFHNLGGKNIYDPMDVVFSVFGLLIGYLIVWKIQPKIYSE